MKVGLLANEAVEAGEMQRRLDAQEKELSSMERALESKEADVKEKDYDCNRLELELSSARAVISRGERVMRGFVELVCTGYCSLLHVQASSYRDQLNAVLADAQKYGEFLGG